jgi:uncharacterized protein (TIGR02145 family)
MKTNPFSLCILLCAALLISLSSGCNKDDSKGSSPVTLNEISDVGFKYAVSTGKFVHNNDATLALVGLCYSDIFDQPSTTNSYGSYRNIRILQDSMGQIDFDCRLIELKVNTTYYVRCAYTKNLLDTLYSNAVSFTTNDFVINSIEFNDELTYGEVSDIEENTYRTIVIGTQTWMAENLKSTKFNDGSSIPLVTSESDFLSATDPVFCNFEYNATLAEPLGKLYNWHVVEQENVCPDGWHVATSSDWAQLNEYVDQQYRCSGKALASKSGWTESFNFECNVGNNLEINDSTGFSAIASGEFQNEVFGAYGHAGAWWSPKFENGDYVPSHYYLTRDRNTLGEDGNAAENRGHSIRCIKD